MFSTISASIEKNLYWIFLIFLYQSIYFIWYIRDKNYTKPQSRSIKKFVSYLSIRLFLMQITVLIGGFVAIASNSPAIGVSLLIILQILINLKLYFSSIKETA
jgi:hypothetical protein